MTSKAIDWEKIKSIVCGIVNEMEKICDELPKGSSWQKMFCGLIGIVELICKQIPSQN